MKQREKESGARGSVRYYDDNHVVYSSIISIMNVRQSDTAAWQEMGTRVLM